MIFYSFIWQISYIVGSHTQQWGSSQEKRWRLIFTYQFTRLKHCTKQLSTIRDTLSLDCSSRSHVLVKCGKKRVSMRPRVWGWLMTCVSDVDRSEGNWVVTLSCTAPLARQDVCECSVRCDLELWANVTS